MSITFTQYLRPNGKKLMVVIDMDKDTEDKAIKLIQHGCHFEIEVLNTGLVAMYSYKRDDEDCISIKLCENGPSIVEGVKELINETYETCIPFLDVDTNNNNQK